MKMKATGGMLAPVADNCNGDPIGPDWGGGFQSGTVPVSRNCGSSDYSPYGTQMFFTWVACSRNQRPSASFELNQSMTRPSFVHTCFRLPVDIAFAAATMPSSP